MGDKSAPKLYDRKTRKAMQKRIREHRPTLDKCVLLACNIFENAELAKTWVLAPNDFFAGKSPLEAIIFGEGDSVVDLLEGRLAIPAEEQARALTHILGKGPQCAKA